MAVHPDDPEAAILEEAEGRGRSGTAWHGRGGPLRGWGHVQVHVPVYRP